MAKNRSLGMKKTSKKDRVSLKKFKIYNLLYQRLNGGEGVEKC